MEATTAKCSLESHLVFGGQQMTVVQGAHQIFPHIGAQPIKYFPMPLIYRKCTPETPCSHGEGECEVDSDCDSSTIPHVCESNCLDRWARQICTKTKTKRQSQRLRQETHWRWVLSQKTWTGLKLCFSGAGFPKKSSLTTPRLTGSLQTRSKCHQYLLSKFHQWSMPDVWSIFCPKPKTSTQPFLVLVWVLFKGVGVLFSPKVLPTEVSMLFSPKRCCRRKCMPDSKCNVEEQGCLYKEDCAEGGWSAERSRKCSKLAKNIKSIKNIKNITKISNIWRTFVK